MSRILSVKVMHLPVGIANLAQKTSVLQYGHFHQFGHEHHMPYFVCNFLPKCDGMEFGISLNMLHILVVVGDPPLDLILVVFRGIKVEFSDAYLSQQL